eukprot:TRINITY_DN9823_c0_g1_i2.p1 TRINITY_DN9823_c0_g1~~TRINITY_DN9823_c0_g1_i2.p1  ORF type:complete len:404 (+),score=118.13 TRINITY_DN9823_c0_g1_i2:65-1276(+)
MGAVLAKLRSIDLDEVFSYQTSKVVVVKDRMLGIIRLLMVLAIFIYVVAFVIVYKKRYLDIEVPVGVSYTSLLKPNRPTLPQNFSYCIGSKNASSEALPCLVWDEYDVQYPSTPYQSMFLTTRVKLSTETRVCGGVNQSMPTGGCSRPWKTTGTDQEYFLADIESFSIRVYHSFQARVFYSETGDSYYSRSSTQMSGSIRDKAGNVIHEFPSNQYDQFDVALLLQAAQVDLGNNVDTEAALDDPESMRHSGIILLVFITYDNLHTTDPIYSYYISRVPGVEFKTVETEPIDALHRANINRHGIKIFFIQSGQIGRFSFQTALIQLVASLGLLSVAGLIVDNLMLYVMPYRKFYQKYKFVETVNFSALPKDELKEDSLSNVVADDPGSTVHPTAYVALPPGDRS